MKFKGLVYVRVLLLASSDISSLWKEFVSKMGRSKPEECAPGKYSLKGGLKLRVYEEMSPTMFGSRRTLWGVVRGDAAVVFDLLGESCFGQVAFSTAYPWRKKNTWEQERNFSTSFHYPDYPAGILSTPVDQLPIPTRAKNLFKGSGLYELGEVVVQSEASIWYYSGGCGEKTKTGVETFLQSWGLTYGMTEEQLLFYHEAHSEDVIKRGLASDFRIVSSDSEGDKRLGEVADLLLRLPKESLEDQAASDETFGKVGIPPGLAIFTRGEDVSGYLLQVSAPLSFLPFFSGLTQKLNERILTQLLFVPQNPKT